MVAKSGLQELSLKIAEYKYFEKSIYLSIIANFLVLMFNDVRYQHTDSQVFSVLETIFLVIFTLEAVIKITAYQGVYFKNNWNIFDFILVAGSLISQFYHN